MAPKKRGGKKKTAPSGSSAGVSRNEEVIVITVPLSGISEEAIRIDLEGNNLMIRAGKGNGEVKKTLTIPEGSCIARKKFSGGVLELTLEPPG